MRYKDINKPDLTLDEKRYMFDYMLRKGGYYYDCEDPNNEYFRNWDTGDQVRIRKKVLAEIRDGFIDWLTEHPELRAGESRNKGTER